MSSAQPRTDDGEDLQTPGIELLFSKLADNRSNLIELDVIEALVKDQRHCDEVECQTIAHHLLTSVIDPDDNAGGGKADASGISLQELDHAYSQMDKPWLNQLFGDPVQELYNSHCMLSGGGSDHGDGKGPLPVAYLEELMAKQGYDVQDASRMISVLGGDVDGGLSEDEFQTAVANSPQIGLTLFGLQPDQIRRDVSFSTSMFSSDSYIDDEDEESFDSLQQLPDFGNHGISNQQIMRGESDIDYEQSDNEELLTPAQKLKRENIIQLFKAADDDHSGNIDAHEFFHVLQEPHLKNSMVSNAFAGASEKFFEALFDKLDDDGNGELDLQEFINAFDGMVDDSGNLIEPTGMHGAQLHAWRVSFDKVMREYTAYKSQMEEDTSQLQYKFDKICVAHEDAVNGHESAVNEAHQFETKLTQEITSHRATKKQLRLMEEALQHQKDETELARASSITPSGIDPDQFDSVVEERDRLLTRNQHLQLLISEKDSRLKRMGEKLNESIKIQPLTKVVEVKGDTDTLEMQTQELEKRLADYRDAISRLFYIVTETEHKMGDPEDLENGQSEMDHTHIPTDDCPPQHKPMLNQFKERLEKLADTHMKLQLEMKDAKQWCQDESYKAQENALKVAALQAELDEKISALIGSENEIMSHQSTLNELQSEKLELKSQLLNLGDENSKLAAVIAGLEETLKGAIEQVDILKAERDKGLEIVSVSNENEIAQKKIAKERLDRVTSLESDLQQMQAMYDGAKLVNKDLSAELLTLKDGIARQGSSSSDELARLKESKATMQADLERLQLQLESNLAQLDERSQLSAEREAALEAMRKRKSELDLLVSKLKVDHNNMSEQLAAQLEKVNVGTMLCEDLRKELADATESKKISESESDALRAKLKEIEGSYELKCAELADQSDQHLTNLQASMNTKESMQLENAALSTDIARLTGQLTAAKNEISDLNSSLAAREKQLQAIQAEQQSINGKSDMLEDELLKMKQHNNDLATKHQALIESAARNSALAEQAMAELVQERDAALASLTSKRQMDLESSLSALRDKLNAEFDLRKRADDSLSEAQNSLSGRERELRAMQDKFSKLEADRSKVQRSLDVANDNLAVYDKDVKVALASLAEATQKNSVLEKKIMDLEGKNIKLKGRCTQLEKDAAKYEASEAERIRNSELLAEAQRSLLASRDDQFAALAKQEEAKKKLDALRSQLDHLRQNSTDFEMVSDLLNKLIVENELKNKVQHPLVDWEQYKASMEARILQKEKEVDDTRHEARRLLSQLLESERELAMRSAEFDSKVRDLSEGLMQEQAVSEQRATIVMTQEMHIASVDAKLEALNFEVEHYRVQNEAYENQLSSAQIAYRDIHQKLEDMQAKEGVSQFHGALEAREFTTAVQIRDRKIKMLEGDILKLQQCTRVLTEEVLRCRRAADQIETFKPYSQKQDGASAGHYITPPQSPKTRSPEAEESSEVVKTFEWLRVVDSYLARQLGSPQEVSLKISSSHICLNDRNHEPISQWPINHIKRYGIENSICSIELGHVSHLHGVLYFDADSDTIAKAAYSTLDEILQQGWA